MEPEDFEFEKNYKEEVKDVVLPQWLRDELPERLPVTYLYWSAKKDTFRFSHVDYSYEDAIEFNTIVEAYDYGCELRKQYDVALDSSVDGHGGRLTQVGFMCDAHDNTGNYRVLSNLTSENIEDMLKHDYLEWLTEISVDYNTDPEDFLKAHKWLSHHPLFWVKGTKEKSFHWATDMGLDKMSVNVWANSETGKPVIFIEHGQHHEAGYTNYYHDTRIFVREETYEKAIVAMAKKVNAIFDLDGYERSVEGDESAE
jgi:hypothetical protein